MTRTRIPPFDLRLGQKHVKDLLWKNTPNFVAGSQKVFERARSQRLYFFAAVELLARDSLVYGDCRKMNTVFNISDKR